MTRCLKFAAVLIAAAVMLLGPSANAATNFPFIGAGSSAAFNVMALAGEAGTTPICTNATSVGVTFNWTVKKGTINGVDNRGTIDPTNGNVWVEWATGTTNPAGPVTAVCLYLNIDSIAGNRLFFGTAASGLPSGTVNLTVPCSTLATTAGANLSSSSPGRPARFAEQRRQRSLRRVARLGVQHSTERYSGRGCEIWSSARSHRLRDDCRWSRLRSGPNRS